MSPKLPPDSIEERGRELTEFDAVAVRRRLFLGSYETRPSMAIAQLDMALDRIEALEAAVRAVRTCGVDRVSKRSRLVRLYALVPDGSEGGGS